MFLLRGPINTRSVQLLRCGYPLFTNCLGSALLDPAEAKGHRHYAQLVSFPLAQTGEGISECELVAWAVKAGDQVAPFDKLCDVQSDKASIEITSRYGGRVVALHHPVGAMVKVGAALVDMEVPDGEQVDPEHLAAAAAGTAAAAAPSTAAAAAAEAQVLVTVPTPTVVVAVQRSDAAGGGGGVAAPSTSCVAATLGAAGAGLAGLVGAAGSPPTAGAILGATSIPHVLGVSAPPPPTSPTPSLSSPPPPPPTPPQVSASVAAPGGVHATPAVRALAKELGVDLSEVAGSGPGGRVTKADVMRHRDAQRPQAAAAAAAAPPSSYGGGQEAAAAPLATPAERHGSGPHQHQHQRSLAEALATYQRMAAAAQPAAAAGEAAAAAAGNGGGPELVPLRGYRRAMVRSMAAAASVPLFHLHDEVHVGRLLALRAELRHEPALREQGIRLTLLPFLLKALSVALYQHPQLNASLTPGGDALALHPHHNIGVAMATPTGLVVPNIKQVERKSVTVIASELSLLQQLAGAGRLPGEALAGGTISVSNIGTIGGTYAAPLVTPPELAIVALGRTSLQPRYPRHLHNTWQPDSGAPPPAAVPTSIMPVSWGADHRGVDGAALASFHTAWKGLLEAPERLLLHTA